MRRSRSGRRSRRGAEPTLRVGHFFGTSVQSVTHGAFVYTDVRYPAALRVPKHAHERPLLCLLVDGGYTETMGEAGRVRFTPGSVAFQPAHQVHEGVIGRTGGRCVNVEIDDPGALAERTLPGDPVDCRSPEMSWLAHRLFHEFLHERSPSPLILEGLTLELLGRVLRQRAPAEPGPPWIQRVVARLEDELSAPVSLRTIAADLGISPVRLSREFRRSRGEGIGEMHRRLRIEAACRALRAPDVALVEVAADLGFADQSHFTRVFRKVTGVTPGEFRRLLGVG